MKTITMLMALLLCAGIGTHAMADGRTFGDGTLPEFLEGYDVDGDGVLSEEERQAMREARRERNETWIERWDTDGDGVISEQEREQARLRLRELIEARRIERFNEWDADDNGCLSFEEFSAIPAVIALAERDPEKPALIFARLDTNDDDKVCLDEFLASLRTRERTSNPQN